MQLFGCLNEEGKKVAFDLYSMKQAIEEGFILDVLQNYVTYKTYFEINKAIEDDPELETIAAKRKIAKYIDCLLYTSPYSSFFHKSHAGSF